MGIKAGKNVECDGAGQWWYFTGGRRVRTVPRVCIRCSESFVPAANMAVEVRFCGHRCAMLAYHEKRISPVVTTSVPPDVFVHGDARKFSCDESGQWWYSSGGYRLKTEVGTCAECGVQFLAAHNRENRQTFYCSRKCGTTAAYRKLQPENRTYANARAYKGGRQYRGGYVFVLVGSDHPGVRGTTKRYLPEHRLVMEQVLGRPLLITERVHHKNGVRDDNRPENLELWKHAHPPGQRVEDKQHCPTCTCFKVTS